MFLEQFADQIWCCRDNQVRHHHNRAVTHLRDSQATHRKDRLQAASMALQALHLPVQLK